jgi:hypothetical protein
MKSLTTDDRQLVHRLLNTGYTARTISELLGCAEGTVKTSRKEYVEDPNWLPTLEYLQKELGLSVSLNPDNNQVELKHAEGISYLPYQLAFN